MEMMILTRSISQRTRQKGQKSCELLENEMKMFAPDSRPFVSRRNWISVKSILGEMVAIATEALAFRDVMLFSARH